MRKRRRPLLGATLAVMGIGALSIVGTVTAQEPTLLDLGLAGDLPGSLFGATAPPVRGIEAFIKDKNAAIRLGKALFWDMQAGSDGIQACASCHFHAGADNRLKNQLSPGLKAGDHTFGNGRGPNYTLTAADFPLRKQANVDERGSKLLSDTNDVVSSQGVHRHDFVDVVPGIGLDIGIGVYDDDFNIKGINTRRVEPRNTPTVINSVFNFRNFWDGRAQNDFNGVNPFGSRDKNARVLKATYTGVELVKIALRNSSLASQAVGPPLSGFESSFDHRAFPKIGIKLLRANPKTGRPMVPLGKQLVHPNDSSLGGIAMSRVKAGAPGLTTNYAAMIREAFHRDWWHSDKIVTYDHTGKVTIKDHPKRPLTTSEYTVMEANFSLFWGLAIQAYEATLIADQSAFDLHLAGVSGAMSKEAIRGWDVFVRKGECAECHGGPEMTNASVDNVQRERIERMVMGDGVEAIYDNGFYNIGVRPTEEDIGVGGKDPFGNPLSDTMMAMMNRFVDPTLATFVKDELDPPLSTFTPGGPAVMGNFKTPGLRNVELTGPYFHNGGKGTLMQVVEFYNRGGDFGGYNFGELDPEIERLELTKQEKHNLVAFLKSLTDERVRHEKAPFDHPQIFVPNGHVGDQTWCVDDGMQQAVDDLIEIPAVGAGGGPALKPVLPQD